MEDLPSVTFSEEGDVESLASTDISILDGEEGKKLLDEETDLSLASSPSLPDDLPAIKYAVDNFHYYCFVECI